MIKLPSIQEEIKQPYNLQKTEELLRKLFSMAPEDIQLQIPFHDVNVPLPIKKKKNKNSFNNQVKYEHFGTNEDHYELPKRVQYNVFFPK